MRVLIGPCLLALVMALSMPALGQSCAYQRDGECDEPGIGTDSCPLGTDALDCAGIGYDTCELAKNGRCDEPTSCPIGSDTSDCRPVSALGPDDCRYAFDGQCDEPGIGTGSCPAGTDTTDCRQRSDPAAGSGADCAFVGDGQCDEPGVGTGLCDAGSDVEDCGALSGTTEGTGIPFEHSCQFALDGECDEPGKGTGNCQAGTDAWDCALPPELRSPSGNEEKAVLKPAEDPEPCLFYGDGQCDEPGIGTGLCAPESDGLDCINLR